jgi:hypothetical protein
VTLRPTIALLALAALLAAGIARAEGGEACAADWTTVEYARVKASVVRVETANGEFGAGFFFGDSCHVATALHVVEAGRSVRLTLIDGRVLPAVVIGTDPEHDLALLSVNPCAQDGAALVAVGLPEVGAPVMVVGNPFATSANSQGVFRGLLERSASAGIVSARTEQFVQTDAAVNPGNSGGPVLDCHGNVVAVADRLLARGVAFAVSSGWLGPLAERAIATPRAYRGAGEFHASVGLQFDVRSSDSYQGISLSDAFILHDLWWFSARIAYMPWGGPASSGASVVQNPSFVASATRIAIDGAFGPRFLLLPFTPMATYLQVAAGGGYVADQVSYTQFGLSPGGGAITASSSTVRTSRWEPLGMVGVFFGGSGSLELSYSLRVDVQRFASSTSQIAIGLWL